MKRFIVISPTDEDVNASLIAEKFPNKHEVLDDRVWMVASRQTTCAEICEELGIGVDGKQGVVIKMDNFYGFYDRALWEKANEWGIQS